MKPVYLEFSGLNSFSEKAEIDFSALLAGGIFGIFGDTGSGKSTILDSIHFALYGVVDRVPQAFNDCINLHSDGVAVTFDFQIVYGGKRKTFRVKRERKRKTGSAKAFLYEKTDANEWLALAEGVSEVDKKVEEIIGLSFNDFKTCIALPQGDFDALVHSKPSERVKLMARLFNLEKYGERLSMSVNAKHANAKKDLEVLQAQMGENEGADEAKLTQATLEVEESEGLVKAVQQEAEKRATEYSQAVTLQTEKRVYEQEKAKLAVLDNRFAVMQEKRELLKRLPFARAVVDARVALDKETRRTDEAIKLLAEARREYDTALKTKELAQGKLKQSDVGERILQANVDLSTVRASAQDIAHEKKCLAELEACKKEYKARKALIQEEDFENKRKELEIQLSALGEDEDLLGFLKRNLKGVMLAETYGEFRADLKKLQAKYPQTETDIAVMLAKYSLQRQSEFSAEDITEAQLAFKQAEEKRKLVKAKAEALEKRYQDYLKRVQELGTIEEQGKLLKQAHTLALEKITSVKALGTEEEIQQRLLRLQAEQRALEQAVENAVQAENKAIATCKQWESLLAQYKVAQADCEKAYTESLQTHGYTSAEDALAVVNRVGNEENASRETERFFEEYALYKAKVAGVDENTFAGVDEQRLEILRLQKETAEKNKLAETVRLGERQAVLKRLLLAREKYKEQEKELAKRQKMEKLYEELKLLVRNNKFLEFIASEYLQEICLSASKTLLSLTGGRYFLKYDEKEFKVGDNLNGGTLRVVKTLSGGETFLVSLSLALSLSGAICAQSQRPIEFFFLDEGFGTLDEKLVDTVMNVLGKLSKTFSVGLISHVEELKRRIEYKAVVTGATETHGSTVRIE